MKHRSVSPIFIHLRDFLRGKKVVHNLRYADLMSARTQPQPEIPGGPYHKTSGIYYFKRDGRREVEPPVELYSPKQITSGDEKKITAQKFITPGKSIDWY